MDRLPDFKAKAAADRAALGKAGALRLLAAGRSFGLAPLLAAGGAILFPHATISVCGHQIAAAVEACLGCGADRVLALGVLHALNDELRGARARFAAGGAAEAEPLRGVQGPGLAGRDQWRREFSLDQFRFLWDVACAERGGSAPELILRYPFLAAGRPDTLPMIDELQEIARGAVVVATADLFHHGLAYGDGGDDALSADAGGLDLARGTIDAGLALLEAGDYPAFERHCALAKSDARDTGQVLRHLRGPMRGRILDLVADDTSGPYGAPAPSWVAGALVALAPTVG